jgi:hypothetical protein
VTEIKRNARGFNVYAKIEDRDQNEIVVQQSSADPLDAVRIFTYSKDGDAVREFVPYRQPSAWTGAPKVGLGPSPGYSAVTPHLDVEGCKALIAALQTHIEYVEGRQCDSDEDEYEADEDDQWVP